MSITVMEAFNMLGLAQEKIKEAEGVQRQAGDMLDEARNMVSAVFSFMQMQGLQEALEIGDSVQSDCHFKMINRMEEFHQAIENAKGN